jgi:hypothetical protein
MRESGDGAAYREEEAATIWRGTYHHSTTALLFLSAPHPLAF